MSEPLHIHPISIGTEDIVDMALIQLVLVLVLAVSQVALRIFARSVDEEDMPLLGIATVVLPRDSAICMKNSGKCWMRRAKRIDKRAYSWYTKFT